MTDPNLESCESGAHFAHPGEPCEEPEQAPAPPAAALRDQIAEAVHATSVCEVGNPVRCGGGCQDAAAAAAPVIEQHTARLHAACSEWMADVKAATERAEQAEAVLAPVRNAAPAPALRTQVAHLIATFTQDRDDWTCTALAEHLAPAIEVGRAVLLGRAEKAEAELDRRAALHADTERRLRADLSAEVRKREAAEAAAETFRHKAVRRALRLARVTGVLDAVREMAAEKVTARSEWGDGYRDAVRDLNEILDGLDPKETP